MISIAEIPLEVGLLTAIPYSFFAIAMKDPSGSHLPTTYCHAPSVVQTKSLCNCSIDQLKRTDTLARSGHGFLMRCLRIGEQMH